MENSRGASKNCIERNTFPHKFKHIPREKSENEKDDKEDNKKDEDLQVDKCTICLCGKFYLSLNMMYTNLCFCLQIFCLV